MRKVDASSRIKIQFIEFLCDKTFNLRLNVFATGSQICDLPKKAV